MFKIAVNNLVQSIGDDVYLPSPSTASSKNLSPLALVERKAGILPFRRCTDYYTTDFTLDDVVDDERTEIEVEEEQLFCTFNRESTVKVSGLLKGYVKGIFDAGVRRVDTITIKAELGQLSILEVNMQSLLDYMHTGKLNMYHELVRELAAKKRRALCVVTGVVKTTADTTITASLNHTFTGSTEIEVSKPSTKAINAITDKINDKRVIGGQMKGVHEKDSSRKLHLPAGTTVAYQVLEMAVDKQGAVRMMVSHAAKGGFKLPSLTIPKTVQSKNGRKSVKKTPTSSDEKKTATTSLDGSQNLLVDRDTTTSG